MMWLTGANNSRAWRAFTLVEIMISVLILGIGLTAVTNSYILALRGVNSVGNNVSALILVKEKFENLELASLNGALPSFPAPENIKFSAKNYSYKQEIIEITEFADLAKYLLSACLEISWVEKNSSKNVTLATYLPKQI